MPFTAAEQTCALKLTSRPLAVCVFYFSGGKLFFKQIFFFSPVGFKWGVCKRLPCVGDQQPSRRIFWVWRLWFCNYNLEHPLLYNEILVERPFVMRSEAVVDTPWCTFILITTSEAVTKNNIFEMDFVNWRSNFDCLFNALGQSIKYSAWPGMCFNIEEICVYVGHANFFRNKLYTFW